MAKKPTRLRFTEDDLTDSQVKKAADRADKAADKAEKAVDKLASNFGKTACHPWYGCDTHIQGASGGIGV